MAATGILFTGTQPFYFSMLKALGKHPTGPYLQRIQQSPQYRNGQFWNLMPTDVNPRGKIWAMAREWYRRPKTVKPAQPLPSVKEDLSRWHPQKPSLRWFGHSSYLLACGTYKCLVDPVLSGYASPVKGMVAAFEGTHVYSPADMPAIDLLLITHDHYDHLDYKTILALAPKVKAVVCPLGVGAHLRYWGIQPEMITELDWQQQASPHAMVQVSARPARHFTGRSTRRYQTLWCSYVLRFFGQHLFIGGDSGYDDAFAQTGLQDGPFDLALLECGQYGRYWPHIHMFPEQTAAAGQALQARQVMPVHWAKFQLSTHAWSEPIERFIQAAQAIHLPWTAPMIGAEMQIGQQAQTRWWQGL